MIQKKALSLHHRNKVASFDRDTHQIKVTTDSVFHANGGPQGAQVPQSFDRWITKAGILHNFIIWSFITSRCGLSFFPSSQSSSIIMFSGIIEEFATVVGIKHDKENIDFTLSCSFVGELSIDQSVAHNGVCLTVVDIAGDTYTVTAMKETLERSNLGRLRVGDKVNVERSMLMNGRLDGHIVQGHVDMTATCIDMKDADGSTYFTFQYAYDKAMARRGYFTVDKGSVTVNGVSLTVCNPSQDSFQVAIIPYSVEHTNFCDIKIGSIVNIEFDILGKYIARLQSLNE